MILTPSPKQQFFGNNGRPLDGGLVFTYAAGTNNKIATYSDKSGTPNTNPIVLDFRGEANIWLDPELTYKFVLSPRGDTDPPTNPIWSVDDIAAGLTVTELTQQFLGRILYPRTQAEIDAGVTPVQYVYPPLDIRRYGTPTAGFYPQSALLDAINVGALAKGAAFIGVGVNVKITAPLDTLTSSVIRIVGAVNCRKDQIESIDGLPTITCDGCALVGAYDLATNTLTFNFSVGTAAILILLQNVCVVGINSTGVAAVFVGSGSTIGEGCHFQDFEQHGLISCGSSYCNFGPMSFYNVGEGRGTSGALDSDNFIDGCAVLAVGSCPSGVPGNMATARAFASNNFGSSNDWDVVAITTDTMETSFKAFIGSNQRSSILRIRAYSGVWLGYCDLFIPSPHLEVYADGGAVANDGEPYAMVTLNSSPRITDPFFTVSTGTDGPMRFLRTTAFSVGTDYWGYFYDQNNFSVSSRMHGAEWVYGAYKPDAGSYDSAGQVVGLGTVANPLAYYEPDLLALLVSKGAHFFPLLSFPQFQSGTITNGNNVTTNAPPYSDWSYGGASAYTDGGVEYEISLVVASSSGQIRHVSVWRYFAMAINSVIFLLQEANPLGGITASVSGSNINIANASGISVNWRAQYRLVGPSVGAPSN